MTQIERIKNKFQNLQKRDVGLSVFGAFMHKYELNAPLAEESILKFERKYSVQLPPDYRNFLLVIGNGGAGPYYGMETLENSLFNSLDECDANDLINPAEQFPLT
ncbi:MAG TPA: SMI1/KNR4 family protein, partial [Nitrosopumilaceae archaeon]|nr:SMI1/KNR4 family protein [Nitrosopumilaceae archaeon]